MDISSSLWVGSYTELFDDEYTHNRARSCGGGYHLPPSTYRARLTGERAAAYEWRRRQQHRDEMAIALHANNMQCWSPSLVARSICYFNVNNPSCNLWRAASGASPLGPSRCSC